VQIYQQCVSPGRQVARATKFCTMATNIFLSSLWNVHRATLLAPKILRRLLDFWKIYRPLTYTSVTVCASMEYKETALFYVTLLSFGR
jgi:hypothetical protein